MSTMTVGETFNRLHWLPSLSDLDPKQLEVINDRFEGTSMVYGPAGGGKTAVTLYRMQALSRQGKRAKVFVYTQVLVQFIRAAATELRLPSDVVEPFYTWAKRLYKEKIGREAPHQQFDRWVDDLIIHFRVHPLREPLFDYVLLDEAQDFAPNVATLLRIVARHLFIAGVSAQSHYSAMPGLDPLIKMWSPLERAIYLFMNYRNPLHIARFAAEFLDPISWNKDQFLVNVVKEEGKKPIRYRLRSVEEQDQVIAHIIPQARASERVGILFLNNEQVDAAARRLSKLNVCVQVARRNQLIDFDNADLPVLSTIHSAKGLEFDWIILPDLTSARWDTPYASKDPDKQRRVFFVAITRAKQRLYLLSYSDECSYLRDVAADLMQMAKWPPERPSTVIPRGGDSLDDLPF